MTESSLCLALWLCFLVDFGFLSISYPPRCSFSVMPSVLSVEDVPAHCGGGGRDDLDRSLQPKLFYNSMLLRTICLMSQSAAVLECM